MQRWIHKQGDQVQSELLPHADKNFRQALERIDLELRVVLDSAEPHKAAFGHLLCFGESFDQAIAAKKEGLKPLITIHRALPGVRPHASVSQSMMPMLVQHLAIDSNRTTGLKISTIKAARVTFP